MGIRLWRHISSKALIRYDKHIFLDIPCTFREENKDMAQTRKLDGLSKGFQNLQNKCSGWKLCLLCFGRGFKKKKKKCFWWWIVKLICKWWIVKMNDQVIAVVRRVRRIGKLNEMKNTDHRILSHEYEDTYRPFAMWAKELERYKKQNRLMQFYKSLNN